MLTKKNLCRLFVLNLFFVLFSYILIIKTDNIHYLRDYSTYFSILGNNKSIEDIKNNSKFNDDDDSLEFCPIEPPDLVGQINVSLSPVPTFRDLESEYNWLKPGGHYSPDCEKNQTIAIIVPYRQRLNQLLLFLKHMHPFFRKKQLNYTLFIIEQNDTLPFNRGKLMNIGFKEALNIYNFSCFIFHDVDLLPENDRNMYECIDIPLHLIASLDKWNYTLPFKDLFGGVVLFKTETYRFVNGFSNRFWGWGGEDDDLYGRVRYHKLNYFRPDNETGRYTMVKHKAEKPNPKRFPLIRNGKKYYNTDGLNDLNYELQGIFKNLLYTNIIVNLNNTSKHI